MAQAIHPPSVVSEVIRMASRKGFPIRCKEGVDVDVLHATLFIVVVERRALAQRDKDFALLKPVPTFRLYHSSRSLPLTA